MINIELKIKKSSNGIHSYVKVDAENIEDDDDIEFLTEIVNISSKYNKKAIDLA